MDATYEKKKAEFEERWERERPVREAANKRFFDWAMANDPEMPADAWKTAMEDETCL